MLICKHCHEVEERPATDVMRMLALEIKAACFNENIKTIEIQDICSKCGALNKQPDLT
jgi:Fur family transcriptional regulator, zinc uptake regulator